MIVSTTAEFVTKQCSDAGSRGNNLRLKFPRPDWGVAGLASVDCSSEQFLLHFMPCRQPLHLEGYDSEIANIEVRFRNNFDKMAAVIEIYRGTQLVFEGNVLQMFTQANMMAVKADVEMKMAAKLERPKPGSSNSSDLRRARPSSSIQSDGSRFSRPNSSDSLATNPYLSPEKAEPVPYYPAEDQTPSPATERIEKPATSSSVKREPPQIAPTTVASAKKPKLETTPDDLADAPAAPTPKPAAAKSKAVKIKQETVVDEKASLEKFFKPVRK